MHDGLMLRFKWGEQRLHSELIRPGARHAFSVGTANGVDFACADVAGAERFTLVPAGEAATVRFPRGVLGTLWRGEDALTLDDAVKQGTAVPDGDGYACTLNRSDAVCIELGGIAVEAFPARIPEAVAADPLDALDLRMINILAAVFIAAAIGIASAMGADAGDFSDDDSPGRSQSLARFVWPPAPSHAEPAVATPHKTEAPSKAGEAPPKPQPSKAVASRGTDARAVARQLGQVMDDVLGKLRLGDDMGVAMSGMKSAGIAGNGIAGMALKGDGLGGGGGETIGLGGIDRPGRGHGSGATCDTLECVGRGFMGKKQQVDLTHVGSEPPVLVTMDKELIRQVIHRHRQEIRYCYELELTKNPSLQGKTSVKFVIGPTGAVSTSRVVDSTMKSSQLEDCVAGRVRTWEFPKPPGGGIAVVTYPFVFRSAGK